MSHRTFLGLCLVVALQVGGAVTSEAADLRFREVVLDPAAAAKTCYAVELADVDGSPDASGPINVESADFSTRPPQR